MSVKHELRGIDNFISMQLQKPYGTDSAQLVELKDNSFRKGYFEGKLKLDEGTSSRSGNSAVVVYPRGQSPSDKEKNTKVRGMSRVLKSLLVFLRGQRKKKKKCAEYCPFF